MTSISAVSDTETSDGFRHWTFIFLPDVGASIGLANLTSSLSDGLSLLDGPDASPIVGDALIGA
jgi:hypothetical protein